MSSATQVASLLEFVKELILHLAEESNFGYKGDLARCARVSALFYDLAVKALWEDLEDWKPLYYVLYRSYGKSRDHQPTVRAPIDDQQWSRLEMYASHVKRVRDLQDGSTMGQRSAQLKSLRMLTDRARGRPIFPNLERVDTIHMDNRPALEPFAFLPPTLRELSLTFPMNNPCGDGPEADPAFEQMLRVLHSKAPALTSFSFSFGRENAPSVVKSQQLTPLRTFTSLQRLEVEISWMCYKGFLRAICAKLPQLTNLSVVLDTPMDGETPEPLEGVPCLGVSTLDEFHMSGHPREIASALEIIAPSPLRAVDLRGPHDRAGWARSLKLLTTQFHSTLDRISISVVVDDELDDYTEPPQLSAFARPLYVLSRLQVFIFDAYTAPRVNTSRLVVKLTDADIRGVANAWPNLRKLVILGKPGNRDGALTITPTCISAFAAKCTQLEALALPFPNASDFSPDTPVTKVAPSVKRLAFAQDAMKSQDARNMRARCTTYFMRILPSIRVFEILPVRAYGEKVAYWKDI
ncbi:hypothetical protein L226DRAFT_538974 [Lentinus tigrinus ALCF2SS1-7]|uniref:F-box domain-containing protein n=1 Tax=Lentinus tigrinus ALCF2SS1-6 TaxID=1328759 RepID=A0A5C2RV83_9APHY|nr:hypothetical protein L227DRAFT_579947 [Lentinus tigrinus ALCF2SS1-6]RPD70328.1 hypothetical protein L226DRAFT_538974 [Lentinus tigrinus ALCF2SS1-7]